MVGKRRLKVGHGERVTHLHLSAKRAAPYAAHYRQNGLTVQLCHGERTPLSTPISLLLARACMRVPENNVLCLLSLLQSSCPYVRLCSDSPAEQFLPTLDYYCFYSVSQEMGERTRRRKNNQMVSPTGSLVTMLVLTVDC